MDGWLGIIGVNRFDADHRPKNWRQKVLELFPNGEAPLTAILSMTESESTDDPEYNWFEDSPPVFGGDTTGIYKNATLTTAYGAGNDLPKGSLVYAKMSATNASQFRPGFEVILRDADANLANDVMGKVVDVQKNGDKSFAAIRLLEDDGTGPEDLSTSAYVLIVGDINPEAGQIPEAISFESAKVSNFTQIFRTPLSLSRTAMQTKFRTGNKYKQEKTKKLRDHSVLLERAGIFGMKSEQLNEQTGEMERTTEGIIRRVKSGAPQNISDYRFLTDAKYAGKLWIEAGETWFNHMLEQVSRAGDINSKLALCGNGALLGVDALAKTGGQMVLRPGARAFGIAIHEWITPVGTMSIKTHPMFNQIPSLRNTMLIIEPRLIKIRPIQDTVYHEDPNNPFIRGNRGSGFDRIDGIKEEYLTELGYEVHHASAHMFLNGVGLDNEETP